MFYYISKTFIVIGLVKCEKNLNPKILRLLLMSIGKRQLFNKMMKEFIVSNEAFVSDTGWKPPYHYSEGIKKTCVWYK